MPCVCGNHTVVKRGTHSEKSQLKTIQTVVIQLRRCFFVVQMNYQPTRTHLYYVETKKICIQFLMSEGWQSAHKGIFFFDC